MSPEPSRDRYEIAIDVTLGLSVWSWALGLLAHEPGPPIAVRLAVAALNGGVGLLLLVRGAARAHGGPAAMLAAIPSIALGGVALKVSPEAWPLAAIVVFALGALGALTSLLALGRSFAILPALRGVVARGLYRVVRHPAYACELAMVVAAGSARAWWVGLALGALALLTLVPRIRAEEALLAEDETWGAYAGAVRWRLVPGLW